ncbi:hypothetical protein FEM48_Zijuj10G0162900 [Ziziphus jujuba var. spinosa]|uniref:Enoyl reductase (ER) domain-containing protein n=1 Tax=Ziziphus jujuba var. spinosa TaxID=714518 RepID=A0A978UPE8_ZIZJJ|nr:hypothetical protein FEM48_Zijuj10G0162900 [Ziziphus jujuba var. spinosa]
MLGQDSVPVRCLESKNGRGTGGRRLDLEAGSLLSEQDLFSKLTIPFEASLANEFSSSAAFFSYVVHNPKGPSIYQNGINNVAYYNWSLLELEVLAIGTIWVEAGHTVLVHAAASGVGSLLCQWANALGATVIGTVSTKDKAAQAKEDGAHHVIIYKEEDFVAHVNEITSGNGVDVVYDSVGKDTFQVMNLSSYFLQRTLKIQSREFAGQGYSIVASLYTWAPSKSLRWIVGMLKTPWVHGEFWGVVRNSRSGTFIRSSSEIAVLKRPSLMQYTTTREELLETAGEVFANIASGVLRVRVNHTYPLSEAAQAHADLEGRKTSGSVVLIP